jgi:hypothetical protein
LTLWEWLSPTFSSYSVTQPQLVRRKWGAKALGRRELPAKCAIIRFDDII